jgi:SAM-dependent methyltransferase
MPYTHAVAERLEAVYLGPDVTAQRADTLARLAARPGEHAIDIGSGPGFLCEALGEAVGPTGRVRGVDLSADMVERAAARNGLDWVSYAEGDAVALPEPDGAYDVVVSTQVAEYVADIGAFCAEAHRVMKPGGRGLILATDWGAVAWHSEQPERMARVLKAFEPHCADPWLPRTLGPRLRAAGFKVTGVSAFPIVNVERSEGSYSRLATQFIATFVRSRSDLPEAEVAAWAEEQDRLAAAGRFFFASSRFIFEIAKPAGL